MGYSLPLVLAPSLSSNYLHQFILQGLLKLAISTDTMDSPLECNKII